jgi:glycosyltransferase involved in cell wall biosynthesis
MRIAQVSTLGTPTRREGSDSIESLVWVLTRELTRLGHKVTVFAAGGSEVDGELVASLPGTYGQAGAPDDWQLCEWINLCRAVEESARFDVLHSHAYLWGLPLQVFSRAPMVHTLHVTPFGDQARLRSLVPDAHVTAISNCQWSAFPQLMPRTVIYHGIDLAQFTLSNQPKDYLCFLGRFIPGKGALKAIAVAREMGLPLRIAGPRNDYFREHIEPHVDGRSVEYVGYVTGQERDNFLGGARALLYPVVNPEPFGLVQVEAMLCGTPVIGTHVGAIPEIIDEGVTGYTVKDPNDWERQVLRAFRLDRTDIRVQASSRFSSQRMAREYAELYQQILSGSYAARRRPKPQTY